MQLLNVKTVPEGNKFNDDQEMSIGKKNYIDLNDFIDNYDTSEQDWTLLLSNRFYK